MTTHSSRRWGTAFATFSSGQAIFDLAGSVQLGRQAEGLGDERWHEWVEHMAMVRARAGLKGY